MDRRHGKRSLPAEASSVERGGGAYGFSGGEIDTSTTHEEDSSPAAAALESGHQDQGMCVSPYSLRNIYLNLI